MSKDQLVLDARLHDVHWQRNQSNPFYSGTGTPALDNALGLQHTALKSEVTRDATGRVVTKADQADESGLPGLKL